ncbi:unnamed protein product [Rodentolepis nana]|uniref:MARVEL domain-containing protein n=1 Tax=Rodentolepis nana TaxID=102285 RepID=A0A0R3T5J1_RODNA|nr:unnamed protein product [Rodentolepis nana]VDO01616.1 unnamed protein product [Rodentolepis nana]
MNRRIGYVLIAFIAASLLIFAVGFNQWYCKSSLLSPACRQQQANVITAVLLLVAALCILLAGGFLIHLIKEGPNWAFLTALIFSAFGAILAIAGVCYYTGNFGQWSPILASIGTGILICLFIAMAFEMAGE